MEENSAARLGVMLFVGFLAVQIGLSGRLGSLLAVLIDPASLVEEAPGGGGDNNGMIGGNFLNLPTTGTLTPGQIGAYALQAGFPASSLQIAIAVALAESSGNIRVIHHNNDGSTDYGLWQINSIHGFDSNSLLTPAYNASSAYKVSSGGTNWQPWTTYTNGAYIRYMSQAAEGAQLAINAKGGK